MSQNNESKRLAKMTMAAAKRIEAAERKENNGQLKENSFAKRALEAAKNNEKNN